MPNVINYAEQFKADLAQKYSRELFTAGLTTNTVQFSGANKIKIPYLTLAGYQDHSRNGGFNRQNVTNAFMEKTLSFDRDVEFFVDTMDVDETNQAVAAANLTNTFEEEHAIPETDAYRISKLYSDWDAAGGTPDKTVISSANILATFDGYMEAMDEAEVPQEGRILYVTPAIQTMLKTATGISRYVNNGDANIQRIVSALDNVTIVSVPSARMKTAYDFTTGFVPAVGAKQVNMMLIQPKSIVACDKHSYIRLWAPGTTTVGDGWLYQNRKYYDLFVIDTRVAGIKINIEA